MFIKKNVCIDVAIMVEVSSGVGAQACDCKRDRLWVRLPLKAIK